MGGFDFSIEQFLLELEYLVNIDSGSKNAEGITRIVDFFAEKYGAMGCNVRRHCFQDIAGPCLEVTNKEEVHYDVLMIGHMDTVFPIGTAAERPFKIEGKRAYGPGVIDMKSGLLLMYYVMMALKNEHSHASVCLALNGDEEIGSRYSKHWLEQLAKKSRYVFILEPARHDGALVIERKGLGRYDIEFQGVAAHAGVEPEKGRSAIEELGHWITVLHGLTNDALGTTVNVGVVSGGTASNVVAEYAKAEVDFRIKNMTEAQRIQETVNRLMKSPKTPGVKVKAVGGVGRPPMNPTEETRKICKIVEGIGQKLGIDVKWAATGGGSDGNYTAALGIPTLDGLGPVGGRAHSIDEYLEIDSVIPRLKLLKELIVVLTQ